MRRSCTSKVVKVSRQGKKVVSRSSSSYKNNVQYRFYSASASSISKFNGGGKRYSASKNLLMNNNSKSKVFIRLYAGALPDHTPLEFPALSPTMEEGGIQEWEKKEGDQITAGDVIAQIETDKTTIAWSSTDDGYLAKILVPAGTKGIKLNSVVAIMVADEKDIAAFKNYSGGDQVDAPAKDPASSESAQDPKQKQQSDQPTLQKDDASQSLQKQNSTGPQHSTPPQQQQQVSQPSQQQQSNQSQQQQSSQQSQPQQQGSQSQPQQQGSQSQPQQQSQQQSGQRVTASPYAKKLAQEKSVDLSQIQGTGPNNRVIAADVNEFQPSQQQASQKAQPQQQQPQQQPQQQQPPTQKSTKLTSQKAPTQQQQSSTQQYTDIPTSQMRRIIAQRLLESKQNIPHYYLTSSIRLDSLLSLRKQLNSNSKTYKLSVNDFVLKASALACKRVPEVNSQFRGDTIRRFNNVDVCVAVNTPDGLFTPIVFNADQKGLVAISENVKDLAAKAKDKKLAPEEYQGGTFTVSNLGMLGVKHFAAVINPPQAAILAVGGVEEQVLVKKGEGGGFEVGSVMEVTLSCDHRVVDGATGAQWLKEFKAFLEDPITMLL